MVFNWFRRQFSNSSPESQVEETENLQAAEETQPVEAEPEESPTEDYLNWAKAAYANIQQQKKSQEDISETETDSSTAPLAETPAVEEAVPTPKTLEKEVIDAGEVTETPAELEISDTFETITSAGLDDERAIAIQPEPVSPEEETTVSETVAAVEEANPVLSEESPPPETVALPVWAREDRQARLERLKATAIEETVEPVTPAVPTQTAAETAVDLAFDEGFLWSAEVLASQGRRPEEVSLEEISWLKRLRQGLDKTRRGLINQLKAIVGQGPLNQDAVMEIEALLLQADVGVEATDYIINTLQDKLRQEVLPPDRAIAYLKEILRNLLDKPYQESYSPTFIPEKETFNIWLMTGVNGVGKTTTIGKIAHLGQKSGYRCLIAAADTFRAAAVEQVKVWGQRSGTEVIANPGKNTDPAAVVYDAIAAAQARGTELLLVDTAGRLQNKKNLMDELSKIRRIVDKKAPDAKVESLLVLDATLGQNGLRQAEVFSQAAQLSGVVLTKLDGTAKGGVALAVVKQLGLPIRFIGAGEGIEDLRPFSSYEFVEALLS